MTFKKAISTLWILPFVLFVALLFTIYDVFSFNFSEPASGKIALFVIYFFWPLLGFFVAVLSITLISEYYIFEGEKKDIYHLKIAVVIAAIGGIVVILLSCFYFGFSMAGQIYFIALLMIGQFIRFLVLKWNLKSQTSTLG